MLDRPRGPYPAAPHPAPATARLPDATGASGPAAARRGLLQPGLMPLRTAAQWFQLTCPLSRRPTFAGCATKVRSDLGNHATRTQVARWMRLLRTYPACISHTIVSAFTVGHSCSENCASRPHPTASVHEIGDAIGSGYSARFRQRVDRRADRPSALRSPRFVGVPCDTRPRPRVDLPRRRTTTYIFGQPHRNLTVVLAAAPPGSAILTPGNASISSARAPEVAACTPHVPRNRQHAHFAFLGLYFSER